MRACRVSASSLMGRTFVAAAAPMNPWGARRWNATGDAKPEGGAKAEAGEGAKAAEGGKPSDMEERVAKLEKQLEEKTAEAKENKDKMVYALADADNARRIAKLDVDKARDFSVTSIAKDMLDVVDTLARAVDAFAKLDDETSKKAAPVLTGVKMSHSVLVQNLGRHGIEKITVAKGTKFDPNLHEALFKGPVTPEVAKDHVSAVVKDGYTLKGRVIRAAQVGVAEAE